MDRGLAAGQMHHRFQAEAMAIDLVGPQTPQISAKSMLSPGNCWPASSC